MLLVDGSGKVLLVEPTYKDYWEIPGGAVEADESPYDAVVRELKEELALPVQPGRSLVTDWVPPRPGRAGQDYLELYRNVLNGDQFRLCPEWDALWFPGEDISRQTHHDLHDAFVSYQFLTGEVPWDFIQPVQR